MLEKNRQSELKNGISYQKNEQNTFLIQQLLIDLNYQYYFHIIILQYYCIFPYILIINFIIIEYSKNNMYPGHHNHHKKYPYQSPNQYNQQYSQPPFQVTPVQYGFNQPYQQPNYQHQYNNNHNQPNFNNPYQQNPIYNSGNHGNFINKPFNYSQQQVSGWGSNYYNNNNWQNQGNIIQNENFGHKNMDQGWGNYQPNQNYNLNNNNYGNQYNDNNGWGQSQNYGNNNNLNTNWGNNNFQSNYNNQYGYNNTKRHVQIRKKHNYMDQWQSPQLNQDSDWFNGQQQYHQSTLLEDNQDIDIKNIIDQQIVFLQTNDSNKLQQLKKAGKIFQDPDFPHDMNSLSGQWGNIPQWKKFQWKRLTSLLKNPTIFDDKIQPMDIKQGQLGDCYFLAALAALAQKPNRIFNLFLQTTINPANYYSVKLLYKGKWKVIEMDQWIPAYNGQPAFSKTLNSQIWVVLLEKAWAKMYGSYKNIEAGFGQEGIHDLTGAHIQSIRFRASDFNKQTTWEYLLESSKLQYCMIGSTQAGSDRNQSVSGIVLGHAYTILKVISLNFNGSEVRLVHLRNPWGKTEAKTAWNDSDPKWNYISQTQKQRIGFAPNGDDGSFFQLYQDFLKDFRIVNVAQINDNASYVYQTQKSSPQKGCYFKVKIYKQGNYSLQINQTPQRVFSKNIQDSYKYGNITLLIGKINGNQVQYIEGTQSAYRTAFKKHRLAIGQYIVFGKIFFTKFQKDFDLTLAIYGDYACQIQQCPPNISLNFKERLYLNRAQQKAPKQIMEGIFYNQQILKQGYIYIACWNNGSRQQKIKAKISKNQNPTVVLKKPYIGQNLIDLNLNPGEYKVILGRVPDFGYTTSGLGTLQFSRNQ